jgi:hypothetical protein
LIAPHNTIEGCEEDIQLEKKFFNVFFLDNKRMASEVPTHELNALVTCELFFLFEIFTLTVLPLLFSRIPKEGIQLTIRVFNKLQSVFRVSIKKDSR